MTAKKIYEIGEIPQMGEVPEEMYAWVIREDRLGVPEKAMQIEKMPVQKPGKDEVLVMVMAVGINYNNVWASQGIPISVIGEDTGYHIGGSDASGIVWAIGDNVKRWKVGDEVIVHCNRDDGDDEECNGGEPMYSKSQRIYGYETNDGSFAQFTTVQSRQLLKKPVHLSWEESGCYTLTLATAYRMLFGHPPHALRPGMNVLVWGSSGGIGSMAVQICKAVDSPSCKILFDIYHQQIQEGNLIPNIDDTWDEIAYFQIGDNPGRKEPTTGEINYKNVFKFIYEKGYDGILGMEHGNSMQGIKGEKALVDAYLKVDSF